MTPPITTFRQIVGDLVAEEFEPEGFPVVHDKLHPSLGSEGAIAGVYPEQEAPSENAASQSLLIVVQVYNRYELEVNPEQRVDPAIIEGWVWRLQRRLAANNSAHEGDFWWFNVASISYPDDPTGNKSRFEMYVEGHGANPALDETSA